jgi:hypothetical protein
MARRSDGDAGDEADEQPAHVPMSHGALEAWTVVDARRRI